MKTNQLLKTLDQSLMDDLYGFCYRRCSNSFDAEDLCSDIVLAVVRAGRRKAEIVSAASFIWKIAHNVYADFCEKRRKNADHTASGDWSELLADAASPSLLLEQEQENDQLRQIFREISFLSKAYREAMILYYLEGYSIPEVAAKLKITPNTVRQRLFSARTAIRKEVENMDRIHPMPTALEKMEFTLWGAGAPATGDPQETCQRQLSKHAVWLCRNKAKSAKEISEALNVPMPYVEEELEMQAQGPKGNYGMLKKLSGGRYISQVLLLNPPETKAAWAVYQKQMDIICGSTADYIQQHKEDYLHIPYLNQTVDLNRILWQQVSDMAHVLGRMVDRILQNKQFAQIERADRPFTLFGYRSFDSHSWGGGWDGVYAANVCGYRHVRLENIYIARIQKHFDCGLNVSQDPVVQMAIRGIKGVEISCLNEEEQEHASKAIQEGYLDRDGDILRTKILAMTMENRKRAFDLNSGLEEYYRETAEQIAGEIADLFYKTVPEHLYGDYPYFHKIAEMPVLDTLVEFLIEKGLLIPPENGVGAEGCWVSVDE